MKLSFAFPIFIFFLLKSATPTISQEMSMDAYERAVSFMRANYNNKSAFNLYTEAKWFEDESGLWFIDYSKNKSTFKQIDFENFEAFNLFDQKRLCSALNAITEEQFTPDSLPITEYKKIGTDSALFKIGQFEYYLNKTNYQISEKKTELEKRNPLQRKSPDGKWIAFAKDYNLFIKSSEDSTEYQLSSDGFKDYEYGSYYGWFDKMEGENGKRPERFHVNWSEDSKWISTSICDTRNANKMYMLDWSVDSLYRPRLLSYYRGSPGDTNMVYVKPVLFDVKNKRQVAIDIPANTHINYTQLNWTNESGVCIAQEVERGFKKNTLRKLDLNTSSMETLMEESSKTNIDNFNYTLFKNKNQLVFLSERSGWRQLYLLDIDTKEVKAISTGDFYVHRIHYIDEINDLIYFTAAGRENKMNPYHQQLYKSDLDGNIVLLTPEPSHHDIQFSPDGNYFVDNYSTVDKPTKTVLRKTEDGTILELLTEANVDAFIKMGWGAPETFSLTGKDGKTKIYGALWKPSNFDPNKSYPIIDNSYTGPHTQVYPKSFDRAFGSQSLAELGFIVMRIDGLGSSGRSKAFHDHSYQNMGNNLEDHVIAIEHLGKTKTWIDTDRVGIHGHSAGGYDVGQGMLRFPETYHVGVASSADHDFRMEKAWWPEMYMGWPVDEKYESASSISLAKNLKGKLLLVHGALDDNVNASATFKLSEALVKADKEFDLLIFPSQRHGYQGPHRLYFIKKRWNYFIEHLLGLKPLWDFKWN